ncbi:unnamed protein product [Rotaria sp. Silwood1]|nr:unnamed protein product [Rotaria sp. Silwood1]CAF4826547.1 unnamed protein product [Rotaria sp. Silwood1]
MAAVVIMNFSNHYGEKLKVSFPNKGFTALANIVQRNGSDIHSRAQLTLMIHITKIQMQLWLAVLLFMKIEGLFVHTSLTQQLEEWTSIVLKTVNHPQIIKLIEDLIHEVFGPNTEIKTMTKYPMQVHFISIDFPTLRGFSGINELFINENHFSAKISEWKSNTRLLDSITQMDLITIALHEYAHVRIRQQVDDMNMSTLNMLQQCQIDKPKCDQEFGRLAEINLFKKQINWFQSKETINTNYVEQFLTAIQNETELPVLTENDGAIPRESSCSLHRLNVYHSRSASVEPQQQTNVTVMNDCENLSETSKEQQILEKKSRQMFEAAVFQRTL